MLDLHIHADQAREIVSAYDSADTPSDLDGLAYEALALLEALLAIHDRNQELGK